MPLAFGQGEPQAKPKVKQFEVASIKIHKDDDGRVEMTIAPGGRFRTTNVSLKMLLESAYDLRPGQLAGAPKWIETERYDIEAKMAEPPAPDQGPDGFRPYLQSLLENRYQLKSHRETRDMPTYQLAVAKGGSKMKESGPDDRGPQIRMGRGQLTCIKVKMEMLARELSRQMGRPVTDQTGLTGDYNFELSWTPDGPAGDGQRPQGEPPPSAPGTDGPTVFTAVQEQLGLKLDSKKSTVQVFIVDKIERPEEN